MSQPSRRRVVQLHTTGTIHRSDPVSPPQSDPLSSLSYGISWILLLVAGSSLVTAIGTWFLLDSWYGISAQRDLAAQVDAANQVAQSVGDRLNQARGALCQQ